MNEELNNVENKEPINIKKLKASFILLLIGQVCFVLSTLSLGGTFKFFPRWLESFEQFLYIACVLMFISMAQIHKLKKAFHYSLISIGISFLALIAAKICATSQESLYIAWGKGLSWSSDILVCVFFIYFFHGCYLLFEDFGIVKHSRKAKIANIVYLIIFVIYFIFRMGKNIQRIMNNALANRVFLYGSWVMVFVLYIYTLIIVIGLAIPVLKMKKGGNENETK